jgi:hypothetical protein
MTTDTKQLALDIKRVMELMPFSGSLEIERVNRLCNIRHKMNEYDGIVVARNVVDDVAPLFTAAPLMADIIRRQGEVIAELAEALATYTWHPGERGQDFLNRMEEDSGTIADNALTLAAPLLEKEHV